MSRPDLRSSKNGIALRRKPQGGKVALHDSGALYGSKPAPHIPCNWRQRLPNPAAYYSQHVAKMGSPNAAGWAQGVCPFHEDHSASLSVHVADARGGWRCFASCGGGDLVSFHQRITGLDFKVAVRDLLGLGVHS